MCYDSLVTSYEQRQLARSYYVGAVALLYDMLGSDDPEIVVEARQSLHVHSDNILDMIEYLEDGWLETEASEDEIEKVKKVAAMIKQHRAELGA